MKVSECKDIFALLSEYLDEELPDDICNQIDSHISACPPCVEFVESLRKTIELTRDFHPADRPVPLPDDARSQLQAAYQKMLGARRQP
ncbi:MAG: hypothetical protein GY953_49040 [bacterium]|nr:hypothetical protein [bacterium]